MRISREWMYASGPKTISFHDAASALALARYREVAETRPRERASVRLMGRITAARRRTSRQVG